MKIVAFGLRGLICGLILGSLLNWPRNVSSGFLETLTDMTQSVFVGGIYYYAVTELFLKSLTPYLVGGVLVGIVAQLVISRTSSSQKHRS